MEPKLALPEFKAWFVGSSTEERGGQKAGKKGRLRKQRSHSPGEGVEGFLAEAGLAGP